MDYQTFETALCRLDRVMYDLESAYIENEGECTEETEQMEAELACLRELLTTEGVDFLGRWMKAKEDAKKALKAEKDYITRRINAIDRTMENIKFKVNQVLTATGTDKVKGTNGYSFAVSTSTTTSVNKDMVKELYQAKVEDAIRDVVPSYITITLGASVKLVPDGEDTPDVFEVSNTPSVRFSKPRAAKEE